LEEDNPEDYAKVKRNKKNPISSNLF